MSTRRRRAAGWLAAVLAAACLAAGCGVPTDASPQTIPDEDVPYDLLSATTTTLLPGTPRAGEHPICLPLGGTLLVLSRSRLGEQPIRSLRDLVAAVQTEGEAQIGVRSAIEEAYIGDVTQEGSTARVALEPDFVELATDQQLLAVAQMTCTLTSQAGIDTVQFEMDGRDIPVPGQGGALIDRPVTRRDYAGLIAG